jgi:cytochrome P450
MSVKKKLILVLYRVARNIAPVVRFQSSAFVFRYEDVVEVLSRDQDFTIGPINAENIGRHVGPFRLGMDQSPQLEREQAVMKSIVLREDAERIRLHTRKVANEILDQAVAKGRFDLVADFTRVVPLRILGDYFGVPGHNEEEMLRWNRLIFWDIFLNQKDDPELRRQAMQASGELNAYLLKLISERSSVLSSGGRLPNDLISRLVTKQGEDKPWLDDDSIRRNISGSLLGGEEPISRVCAQSLGELLKRPKAMAAIRAAAEKDDVVAVRGLAFDALRYNPSNPLLMRFSEKDQTVGSKKRRIKAGSKVYAMTQCAMFDPTVFPKPKAILADRPLQNYLHFGYGLHVCYGTYINWVIIPEMLTALLQRKDLQPVGEMVKEGPFPNTWAWKVVK